MSDDWELPEVSDDWDASYAGADSLENSPEYGEYDASGTPQTRDGEVVPRGDRGPATSYTIVWPKTIRARRPKGNANVHTVVETFANGATVTRKEKVPRVLQCGVTTPVGERDVTVVTERAYQLSIHDATKPAAKYPARAQHEIGVKSYVTARTIAKVRKAFKETLDDTDCHPKTRDAKRAFKKSLKACLELTDDDIRNGAPSVPRAKARTPKQVVAAMERKERKYFSHHYQVEWKALDKADRIPKQFKMSDWHPLPKVPHPQVIGHYEFVTVRTEHVYKSGKRAMEQWKVYCFFDERDGSVSFPPVVDGKVSFPRSKPQQTLPLFRIPDEVDDEFCVNRIEPTAERPALRIITYGVTWRKGRTNHAFEECWWVPPLDVKHRLPAGEMDYEPTTREYLLKCVSNYTSEQVHDEWVRRQVKRCNTPREPVTIKRNTIKCYTDTVTGREVQVLPAHWETIFPCYERSPFKSMVGTRKAGTAGRRTGGAFAAHVYWVKPVHPERGETRRRYVTVSTTPNPDSKVAHERAAKWLKGYRNVLAVLGDDIVVSGKRRPRVGVTTFLKDAVTGVWVDISKRICFARDIRGGE